MIEDAPQPQISLFKGLTFSFRDGDQIIVLHASNFTGKEQVTVNGTVVSESRGFSRHTHHVFDVNGHAYRIALQSIDLMKGHIECSLFKSDDLMQRYSVRYHRRPSPRSWPRHLFPITAGILIGWLYPFDLVSFWSVGGIILLGGFIGGLYILFTQKGVWQSELSFPHTSP